MRVLFASNPALGHLHPMLPLVRAAQRAGAEVVVATGPDLAADLPGRGVASWAAGPAWPDVLRALADPAGDAPEEPGGARLLRDAHRLFGAPAVTRVDELLGRARRWRPDLVVSELAELSGAVLADDLGVPHVVHGYGPVQPGLDLVVDELVHRLAERTGRPGLLARLCESTYVDVCPPSMRTDVAMPWQRCLSLRPSAGETTAQDHLPDAVRRLLRWDRPGDSAGDTAGETGRDTVYVTLGTVFNDPHALGHAVDALQTLPVDLVVTTGTTGGTQALGPRPAHVRVVDYLPQALLLPHCAAVVSHGGAGTLLGGLVHGLPQVFLPQGADQASNAAAACRRGVGTTCEDPAALPAALHAVLREPGPRAAAEAVAREIAAMPAADAVFRQLADTGAATALPPSPPRGPVGAGTG